MPAKSKAQQRLFGLARAIQKGEVEPSVNSAASNIAETVLPSSVKDFAKTKRKGLKERLAKRRVK